MKHRLVRVMVAISASAALLSVAGMTSAEANPVASTLYVSAASPQHGFAFNSPGRGGDRTGRGCDDASFLTISAAVAAASTGTTIVICPGIYRENVVVPATKQLTVEGLGNPVVDSPSTCTGPAAGVQVLSSGSEIEGLTVENACGEGILVGSVPGAGDTVSNVTISGNTVINNDQGNPTGLPLGTGGLTASPYGECNATPQPAPAPAVPGDCGEGIHLLSADNSSVVGNEVRGDTGGILLTDENGPTYGNVIKNNDVSNNRYDCGVTVAGHNIALAGGVYDNIIVGNQITGNGTLGQGAGVLLASPVPGDVSTYGTGGSVYNNVVQGNHISGNGLGAVTLHSHAPGQNLSGNTITGNVIGTNNLAPDDDFGPTYQDLSTTGVIVVAVSPVTITIARNLIVNDVDGVYLGDAGGPGTITAIGVSSNLFLHVTNPVVTVP